MKRILTALLTVMLAVSMAAGAFAATAGKLQDVDAKTFQANLKSNGENGLILLNKKTAKLDALTSLEVAAGAEIKIYLTANLFVDGSGNNLAGNSKDPVYVTRAQIREGKISLRRSSSRGSKAYDSVSIKYDGKGAYINIKFVDPYASTKELEFSTTLYLYVDGERCKNSNISLAGTLANETVEVYSDSDYVDISEGRIAVADEYARNVELDLGNGLTVFTGMSRNKKIYAVCSTELSDADVAVLERYPAVVEVFTLSTVNLKPSDSKPVSIDTDGEQLYVYSESGVYLGTSDNRLPFASKYYLSAEKYNSLQLAQ